MFEPFLTKNNFKIEHPIGKDFDASNFNPEMKVFFRDCGGCTFNNGLYRTHDINSSLKWATVIGTYFPKYKDMIIPFGYDWIGRQFTLDKNRQNYILMFDCSTAEDFELQQNIIAFHNEDLINDREVVLSEQLFNKCLKALKVNGVLYEDCVGYKVPLFLGGVDNLENYEIINMEVYWEFQCQIYLQIKDLPPGTKVDKIKWEKK